MTTIEKKNTGSRNRFIGFLLGKLLPEKYREAFIGDFLESDEV
jgi:hypothetical protein